MKKSSTSFKAAAIQFEPTMFQKDANIQKLLEWTGTAAKEGAKLIVLPEMCTTGYSWYSQDEIKAFVEEIPGPTTYRFGDIAKLHNCIIVIGLPEVDIISGNYYNSLAFISPMGLLGKYRKTHLFVSDSRWAQDGNLDYPVFDTEIGSITGVICQDLMYFEPLRILTLKGAQIICCSSNWLRETRPSLIWKIRAFENSIFLICANRWGVERGISFNGNTCIINPDGSIQSKKVDGDGVVYAKIDIDVTKSKSFTNDGVNDKIAGRKPHNYRLLSVNPYKHNPTRYFRLNEYRPLPKGDRSLISTVFVRDIPANLENRLKQFEGFLNRIGERVPGRLQLITLPELFFGKLDGNSVEKKYACQIPGKSIATIEKLASTYDLYLVIGVMEIEKGNIYNTAILVGPKGYIGKYRKIHLSPWDHNWAKEGDLGFPTFDTPIGRIGLLVGYDILFPESVRCLALSGADLICVPSALRFCNLSFGRGKEFSEAFGIDSMFHIRAGENNVYLAVAEWVEADHYTKDKLGCLRGIWGPTLWTADTSQQIEIGDNEIVSLSFIDTTSLHDYFQTNIVRNKELLALRQTGLYNLLIQ